MTTTPAITNITAGGATNLTATIALRNGFGSSARFAGPAILTATVAPSDPNITATMNPATLNFPTTDTTLFSTVTVATTSLLLSNTYIVTIIANTNPPTPVNPNVTPVTNTYTITMGTTPLFNPVKTWTPGGVNGNWSTAGNWSPSGAPDSSNDVLFIDLGAVGTPGTVDNTVDSAFTLGSLTYGQTNNFHTTSIGSGLALTITGTNGLSAGTGTDSGDLQLTNTITGTGAAVVVSNASALIKIIQSHPTTGNPSPPSHSQATLDLSGLDAFSASVSRVLVGVDATIKGASGILELAKTNLITTTPGAAAPQFDVGDNTQSTGSAATGSFLVLGQTNAIFADSLAVGRGKTDIAGGHSMLFNSSLVNPAAYFRGTNGANSRVSSWIIADAQGAKTGLSAPTGNAATNDFTGGNVNALVDTMSIGKGASSAIANGANVPAFGTLTFNAGTIDVNTLQVGVSTAEAAGFAWVNANGGTLTVNSSLQLAQGSGGSGTLTVAGATVNANNGISAGAGAATIALVNGTLNATNAAATIGTSVTPISTLQVTNSTLKLAVQQLTPSATVGTLSADGSNPLSFGSLPLVTAYPAQCTIISYGSADANLASFTLGSLPASSPAFVGYISNNTANFSIDLILTGGPLTFPLVWDGSAGSSWDTTTLNWKTNGVLTRYSQNYPVVRFDDSRTGSSTANLTTTLTPGSLMVSNSSDYTFTGSGKLSGSMSLTKLGSAALLLTESGGDDFTGGLNVDEGTVQIGNGATSGTLAPGAVSVANGATLAFNRSDNVSASSVISGLGTVAQNGASTLSLSASNSGFSGGLFVAHGTLQPGNPAALGAPAATVTVSNGATLDLNGQSFNNNQSVTVAGAGVGGAGALVNNSTNSPTKVLRNVTLSDNTTFGGFSDWDIHSSANGASDANLSTGPVKLTKAGTNTVTLFGVQVDGSLGDIDILGGTFSFERNTSSMGDSTRTVTVFTNATLQLQNASNVWTKAVVLKDGGTFRGINLDEFAGPVTLESGSGTILAGSGAQLILDAAIGGAGGLTKNGAGALTLTQPSTFTGST
ncbi:MAG TPA: hypothetical protein VLT36_13085, partial [Candidatus Dormibacteraeota bacterium]|nr:hypothetical protein [Candidatus Dormibacteraeota bacterium]